MIIRGFVLLALLFTLLPPAHSAGAEAALRLLAADDSRLLVELTSPAPSLTETLLDGASYTRLEMTGLSTAAAPGAPALPAHARLIALPPGATASLHIDADPPEVVALAAPLLPVPSQRAELDPETLWPRPAGLAYAPDGAIYAGAAPFPPALAELSDPTDWRGQQVARLQIHPVQYDPARAELRIHRRVRVEIRFSGPPLPRTAPPPDPIFEKLRAGLLLNPAQADGWRTRPTPSPAPRRAADDQPWHKLSLREEGLYALTCADLAGAGMDLNALRLESVQLFHGGPGGQEIALSVHDSGAPDRCDGDDRLHFWGQAIDSKYTDVNVYWLTHGAAAGLRMASRAAQPGGASVLTTTTSLRLEQNRYYAPHMPRIEGYEHWFWDLLSTTNPNYPRTRTYTFTLEAGASFTALRGVLSGYSGPHRTQLWLNGTRLGEENWRDTRLHQPEYSIPSGLPAEGSNAISVTESYAGSSLVVVDNFVLTGSRPLTAQADRLDFSPPAPGHWRYQTGGFASASIHLLDITDPARPVGITGAEIAAPCPCGLAFGEAVTSTARYAAVGATGVRAPLSLAVAAPAQLTAPAAGADYILISPASLRPALDSLLDLRASQGLRVAAVDVQAIYDEFGGGIPDPAAIRAFLAWAYANWPPPAPTFAVLVGDGHYDPKGYCATAGVCLNSIVTPADSSGLIPPNLALVDPWIGETAADAQLVAFNDDNSLPFLALGRLPVNSLAEAQAVVAKIVAYEQTPPAGEWRSKVTFVTDNAYAANGQLDPAGNFWQLSDKVADDPQLLLPTLSGERLYLNTCNPAIYPQCALADPPHPPYTSGPALTGALISAINEGRVLINYVGHASTSAWAGNPVLFRTSDLAQLHNGGKLPLLLDMTCLTGYYHQPPERFSALSESLLRAADGGSIAVWAATGLSVVNGHDHMHRGFLHAVMQQGICPIGLAALAGLQTLYRDGGGNYLENLDTFLVIGDPATRLSLAGGPPPATATPTVTPTVTATPTATATPTGTPTPASLYLPSVQSGSD